MRFSEGFWPDLLFTAGLTGKFLLSFTPALLLILLLNYQDSKKITADNRSMLGVILAVTIYSGLPSLSRLDYSLESFSYMLASVSGVLILLLISMAAPGKTGRVRLLLPALFLCGWLAGEVTLAYHQQIEKFTYFSEKALNYLAAQPGKLALITGGENFALLSFSLYIGLAEEFFKFLFLILPFYSTLRKGNLADVFLLTLFSAGGFAAFENIIYAYNYGVNLSIVRNIFNGHIFFAVWTALLLHTVSVTANRFKNGNAAYVLLLFPLYTQIAILHGGWDFIAVKLTAFPTLSYTILGGSYLIALAVAIWRLKSIAPISSYQLELSMTEKHTPQ